MFKINKAFLTYSWRWKINEDLCGICQQTFDQMCPKCTHPIECKPGVGKCDHTYHVHCIADWIIKKRFCPMCRVPWSVKRTFDSAN